MAPIPSPNRQTTDRYFQLLQALQRGLHSYLWNHALEARLLLQYGLDFIGIQMPTEATLGPATLGSALSGTFSTITIRPDGLRTAVTCRSKLFQKADYR